jgi:hypothetical protein
MSATKQPSGAQKRKARKLAEEQARRDEEVRRALQGEHKPEIKKPPIGDPVAGVAWASDVALSLLWEVINDKQIDAERRWRYAADFIAKIGMTYAKAHVQKRLAALVEKEDEDEDASVEDPVQEDEEDEDALQTDPIA